jgi:glutathione S-transferase
MAHPLPAAVAPAVTLPNQGPPKIHLYTVGTPNGYKASVMLEELRAAYPDKALAELSYDVIPISFANLDQKVGMVGSGEGVWLWMRWMWMGA